MIIGISGKIGSGKDTIGKIIQILTLFPKISTKRVIQELNKEYSNHIFEIQKFGGVLKDIVCLLINCTKEQLEDHDFKNTPLGKEWEVFQYAHSFYRDMDGRPIMDMVKCSEEKYLEERAINWQTTSSYELTPRLLLQLMGTECGRQIIHPNLWVLSLMNKYLGDVEEWKDIENYEDSYEVSSFGRIRRKARVSSYGTDKGEYHTYEDLILKPTISGKYLTVKLLNRKTFTVHSLVANAFCIKAEDSEVVNHKDQNPLNNFYKNLEWCTYSHNIKEANRLGNGNTGERQADAKLTEKEVEQIKIYLQNKLYKQNQIAKRFNVSTTTISDIKHGRKWKHVGVKKEIIEPILPKATPNWVITDVRFPNEVKAIEDKGGFIIRVTRNVACGECNEGTCNCFKNHEVKAHPSETALDNHSFDILVDNDGTIEELIEQIKVILIFKNII